MEGTAVSVGNVDAHVCVPAVKIEGPGKMLAIMGLSLIHIYKGEKAAAAAAVENAVALPQQAAGLAAESEMCIRDRRCSVRTRTSAVICTLTT